MKRSKGILRFLLVALAVLGWVESAGAAPANNLRETDNPTPLDEYIAKPDDSYAYELVSTTAHDDWTAYVIEMTSQQWRSADEVDRTLWKHWVTIIKPSEVESRTALLLIGGSNNSGKPPRGAGPANRRIARDTKSVVAEIRMVPNQPLVFADDGKRRSEDSIIAYTWDKYMRTGDPQWILRLPMTKSVVRAMDTVQSFCASAEGGKLPIDHFVLAGASKRGWTTWTATAVDRRVVAMAPIVIDLLNLVPSFRHHWSVYGHWAPAINDYVRMKIMDWLDTKEFAAMMDIVEPYSYRDRFTMPKLLMNATGDQFFLPDSAQFYVNDLKGPTYFRYVPNTGHGLNSGAIDSVNSFYHAIVTGAEFPKYSWRYPGENIIRVETPSNPIAVKLWQATNPDARTFRIDVVGEIWTSTALSEFRDGVYIARVRKPEKGWTAFMVELTFPGPGDANFTFTTPVRVVPDRTPYQYQPPASPPKGFLTK